MTLTHRAKRAGRLRSFLTGELGLSAGLVNRLKWDGSIQVNGVHQWMNYEVRVDDEITVQLREPEPNYPAEEGPLEILFEDPYLLAVDKPAGMLIHPSQAKNTGTLANYVLGYYRSSNQQAAFHPLTRLDRDTFGVVLLAKSSHIHTMLQQRPVQKTYHALVFHGPEENSGVIDAPIARRPLPSLLREVSETGKRSVTEFEVLSRKGAVCALALRPVTGRTHQLRVHCAYRGFPILGDPQYGSEASKALSETMGLHTQALCAKELKLTHPFTGEMLTIQSRMALPL